MEDRLQDKEFSLRYITILCRIVFAIILIDLTLAGFSSVLAHQLQSPVLKFPYVDPTFWAMHLMHIPEFMTSHFYVSWALDILLFGTCIGALIFPEKKWIIALFIMSYFVYYIIFNSFGAHHTHSRIPILMAPVPFLFSKKSFSYAWEALRYFTIFSYSAAFLWKFFRFSWLNDNQGILILKKNLAPYLYFNPDTFLAEVYVWFLNNPAWLNFIFFTGFILEGIFIIGFFTKKYDRYLFYISLLLPVGFWFLADALFFEQIVLSLTLLHISPGSGYFKMR